MSQQQLDNLCKRFVYLQDGKVDSWRIMTIDEDGQYRGDCDDFAITAWWYLCNGDYKAFWWGITTFKVKFHRVITAKGIPHLVLEYKGQFIDNGFKRWVNKTDMPYVFDGYKINNVVMVAIKMLLGKLFH